MLLNLANIVKFIKEANEANNILSTKEKKMSDMIDRDDIGKVLKEKKKELRKLQKELEKLEEIKRRALKPKSPEIREISNSIQTLAADRMTTTDAIIELVMEAIEKYPFKRKAGARKPVAPKYRNPDNPEQTWTGRGRQPTWVKEALKKYTLDEMRIKPVEVETENNPQVKSYGHSTVSVD